MYVKGSVEKQAKYVNIQEISAERQKLFKKEPKNMLEMKTTKIKNKKNYLVNLIHRGKDQ